MTTNPECDLCLDKPKCDLKKTKCNGPHKKIEDAPCVVCGGSCYNPCPYGGPFVLIEAE